MLPKHDPAKFQEFRCRYLAELDQPRSREALDRLRDLAAKTGPYSTIPDETPRERLGSLRRGR
jgi:uncharacterized protein YeaO (DUF488 family)